MNRTLILILTTALVAAAHGRDDEPDPRAAVRHVERKERWGQGDKF